MEFATTGLIFEGMTSVSALINATRQGKARRRIIAVYFDKNKIRKERGRFSFIKHAAEELGFELRIVDTPRLCELVSGNTHGGICAETTEAIYPELVTESIKPKGFSAVIEGVEDPYSLGYSLRALYACGCDSVLLPRHLPESADSLLCKSSAGASELLDIYVGDTFELALAFKEKGYRVACAAIPDSDVCYASKLDLPLLLVIGGEKRGISANLMSLKDINVRIPYGRDFLGSLSTASAVSILAYEVLRQNSDIDS